MGNRQPNEVEIPWLNWLVKFFVTLFLLMALASVNSASSLPSSNNNETAGAWKAQFFYGTLLRENTDENLDSSAFKYEPTYHELNSALRKYKEASQGIIRQLSMSHEVALRTEHLMSLQQDSQTAADTTESPVLLSAALERKISMVAELSEQNVFILERILLKPFPVTMGLSKHTNTPINAANISTTPESHKPLLKGKSQFTSSLARYIPPYKSNQANANDNEFGLEDQSYEDASQVIAHTTRDWTVEGAPIRQITYDWIVKQLWTYHKQLEGESSSLSPVFVPGAGLGRLAYDVAFAYEEVNRQVKLPDNQKQYCYPFEVEAVDSSLVMAAAAYHILNNSTHRQDRIYPFVLDPFTNEVDTERRWQSMTFPESSVLKCTTHFGAPESREAGISVNTPSLSYTVGDFVTIYASRAKRNIYGAITTSFFIDTATNIYEYILTIKNLLQSDGLWINVGPVQWHRNAQLQPTVCELRQIIELFGFTIHHWEVEDRLMGYRHKDDAIPSALGSRFTRAEGYRPLKFVASYDGTADTEDLLPVLEKLRLSTGRKSMINQAWRAQDQNTD